MKNETKVKLQEFLVVSVSFGVVFLIVIAIIATNRAEKRNKQTLTNKANWKVLSEQEATVVSVQVGKDRGWHITEYTLYITIQTANGEKATFSGFTDTKKPSTKLSVGDACVLYKKQYSGEPLSWAVMNLEKGDTAWFIDDEIAFYKTEKEMSEKYLKDYS